MKKTSNIKYLGYGLLIGSGIAALIIGVAFFAFSKETAQAAVMPVFITDTVVVPEPAISPTPANTLTPLATFQFIPIDTPTFTPTPTLIYLTPPTITDTPSPTATRSPGEEKASTGELHITGPLTREEQIRLYEMSITFIAPTTSESIKVGEQIASKGYGSPTLICGPLSIAILQTSGLIRTDIAPIKFWLLNPFVKQDRARLDSVFPEEQYEHFEINTPINKIDYSAFPLMPGDFLYVKHGSGGNFDHMMVVNRVDVFGRAYSVTNYNSPDAGFIINETMLYDLNDPQAGVFKLWTKQRNAIAGATGYGGFELWRRKAKP